MAAMGRCGIEMSDEIRRALESLKARFGIQQVYVFGSYARGDASIESDLDVLAVVDDLHEDPFVLAYELRRHLHESLDMALDVVVTSRDQFVRRQQSKWTIEHVASIEGIAV